MSNASSMTSIPRRSAASRNAGAGGLCEQRIALNPLAFSNSTRRSSALSYGLAPSGP